MKKTIALCCALALAAAAASADEMDDMFSDPGASEIAEAKTIENPEQTIVGSNPFQWGGDLNMTAGAGPRYEKAIADITDWSAYDDELMFSMKGRLWFDARPDQSLRVFGKFTADYPFSKTALSGATLTGDGMGGSSLSTTSTAINSIKVFELFTDFDWNDTVYFRVGKQNTGWGVSRFYQVADPLSVGVKDPTDPTADLEGPVAIKVSVPFGLNSVVLIGAFKDSYLPSDLNEASICDAGVGAKADFLVPVPKNDILGNGQLSVGAYYQRKLAPKFIASYSTGIWKFQVFTDQVVQLGLDSYRLASDTESWNVSSYPAGEVYKTEKPDTPFYSATVGTMYVNSDWDFTLYAEYLYNGAGSTKTSCYKDWLTRYAAESISGTSLTKTLSSSDIAGYLGMHNTALSLSWSELFNSDKFSFAATWLQDWVDFSGMVKPALTWKPFKHFTVECGAVLAWGDDKTEWVIKTMDTSTLKPARTLGYIAFKLSDVKF